MKADSDQTRHTHLDQQRRPEGEGCEACDLLWARQRERVGTKPKTSKAVVETDGIYQRLVDKKARYRQQRQLLKEHTTDDRNG